MIEWFKTGKYNDNTRKPLRVLIFIDDPQLENLARDLQTFGYSTSFAEILLGNQFIAAACHEKRTILSRGRELFKSPRVLRGYDV